MMKEISSYGILTPRIRGRRSFMLVKSDYDAMMGAENVQAALRRLEGTRYRPFLTQMFMEEVDIYRIEESLVKAYHAEVKFILSHLRNKEAINFFQELHRSLELKCLANIVKSILLDVEWDKVSRSLLPYGKFDASTCKSLVENKNIKRALQFFQDKALLKNIEEILRGTDNPSRQALEVDTAISKHTLMKTWQKLNEVKGRDRYSIELMGIASDMTNAMTVLRMKKLGFKTDEISEYLIPVYHKLEEDELKRSALAPTDKDAVKIFTAGHYAGVVSPLISTYEVEGDLSIFETAFKRFHADECRKIFVLRFFHLGEALAYLYIKMYEVRDLIAILIAKNLDLPTNKIEPNLVLHQPLHPL
ncbi:MAG: V-type ATPase subunit [Candidatus Bathyarchaeota archaeon]